MDTGGGYPRYLTTARLPPAPYPAMPHPRNSDTQRSDKSNPSTYRQGRTPATPAHPAPAPSCKTAVPCQSAAALCHKTDKASLPAISLTCSLINVKNFSMKKHPFPNKLTVSAYNNIRICSFKNGCSFFSLYLYS